MEQTLEALTLLTKKAGDEQKRLLEALIIQLKKQENLQPVVEALLLQNKNDNAKLIKSFSGLVEKFDSKEEGQTFVVKAVKGDKGDTGDKGDKGDTPDVSEVAEEASNKVIDEIGADIDAIYEKVNDTLKQLPKEDVDFLNPETVRQLILKLIVDNRVDDVSQNTLSVVKDIIESNKKTFDKNIKDIVANIPEGQTADEIMDIVKKGGLSVDDIKDMNNILGKFNGHNHYIAQLSDIEIPNTLTDGYVITWNETKKKFDLQEGGGGSITGTDKTLGFFDGDDNFVELPELTWDKTTNKLDLEGISTYVSGANGYIEGTGAVSNMRFQVAGNAFVGAGWDEVYVGNEVANKGGRLRIIGNSTAGQGAVLRMRKGGSNNGKYIDIQSPDGDSSNYLQTIQDKSGTIALLSDITGDNLGDHTATQTLDMDDNSIENVDDIEVKGHSYADAEVTASASLDWTKGNHQYLLVKGTTTLTFTDPSGPTTLILRTKVDPAGGTISFPASVKWSGGTAPTYSTGSGDIDVYSFYFDGTDYYGGFIADFQ